MVAAGGTGGGVRGEASFVDSRAEGGTTGAGQHGSVRAKLLGSSRQQPHKSDEGFGEAERRSDSRGFTSTMTTMTMMGGAGGAVGLPVPSEGPSMGGAEAAMQPPPVVRTDMNQPPHSPSPHPPHRDAYLHHYRRRNDATGTAEAQPHAPLQRDTHASASANANAAQLDALPAGSPPQSRHLRADHRLASDRSLSDSAYRRHLHDALPAFTTASFHHHHSGGDGSNPPYHHLTTRADLASHLLRPPSHGSLTSGPSGALSRSESSLFPPSSSPSVLPSSPLHHSLLSPRYRDGAPWRSHHHESLSAEYHHHIADHHSHRRVAHDQHQDGDQLIPVPAVADALSSPYGMGSAHEAVTR